MIKSIRVVYQTKSVFGGRRQTEETTYTVDEEAVKRAFALLKSKPHDTAVWFDFGSRALGYWFDTYADAEAGALTSRLCQNSGYWGSSLTTVSDAKRRILAYLKRAK